MLPACLLPPAASQSPHWSNGQRNFHINHFLIGVQRLNCNCFRLDFGNGFTVAGIVVGRSVVTGVPLCNSECLHYFSADLVQTKQNQSPPYEQRYTLPPHRGTDDTQRPVHLQYHHDRNILLHFFSSLYIYLPQHNITFQTVSVH